MSDKINNKPEAASITGKGPALIESVTREDMQMAQKALRVTAAASAAVPELHIFDSTDIKPAVQSNLTHWDTDSNRSLSMDELNAVLRQGDSSAAEKAAAGLKQAFAYIDENKDGELSHDELKEYYESAVVYERTRARVDAFTDLAKFNFDKIDENNDKILSKRELMAYANDRANDLSQADRQIVREFATADYGLVARQHTSESNPTGQDAPMTITRSDLDTAGKRLRGKTVEDYRMLAPGLVHEMYQAE